MSRVRENRTPGSREGAGNGATWPRSLGWHSHPGNRQKTGPGPPSGTATAPALYPTNLPRRNWLEMGGAASRWVDDFSPGALKAIGALEFLAAVGLIVPAALGIAPVLVPLAATGAVLLFAGAVIMRLRRGERATIIGDLVYLAMAASVAWGRFGPGSSPGRPARRR